MLEALAFSLDLLPPPAYVARPWEKDALRAEELRRFLLEQSRRQSTSAPVWGERPPTAAGAPSAAHAAYQVARPSEALAAIKRLRTMAGFGANWDGEGSPAADPATVDAAVIMIGFLSSETIRIRATLDPLGQPLIMISRGEDEGEITFTDPETFEFAWFSTQGEFGDVDLAFDGQALPNALSRALALPQLVAA